MEPYRSESIGQVFLITVAWLYQRLQNVPENEWSDLFVAYDNMCQLNRLRVANNPLQLGPYDAMWQKVTKIIDGLHLSNHKNPTCNEKYNPDRVIVRFGEDVTRNRHAAGPTFSWLTKFTKQLNSMPKERQMFFY